MKVLVAGASGAIGMPLVRQLRDAGHESVAIHRSAAARARLVAAGADPIQVDVLDRAALLRAVDGRRCDAVICQLSALQKAPLRHRDMAPTDRLRIDGTANLLAAAERVGATRFVTQSMVFGYGYGDFGDRVLTEADAFGSPSGDAFDAHLEAMRSNEHQVRHAPGMAGIALRYGLLYGPGAASAALVDGLRRRRLPVIRQGAVRPWLYIDDAASAAVAALDHGTPGSAYNIADTEPVSFTDLVVATAEAIAAPRPRAMPRWLLAPMPYAKAMMTAGMRVDTTRATDELGWSASMPTYREGVAALAASLRGRAA